MDTIDWDYWSNLADVTIDQATMLSCGQNPFDLHPGETIDQRALCDTTYELPKRLAAARSHVNAGSLQTRYDREHLCRVVTLRGFRQWSESLPVPFTFPEGFPRVEPEPAAPDAVAAKPDKPIREDGRENLLRVIRALHALAEVKDRGGAGQVERKLVALGFRKADKTPNPGHTTVAAILKEAADLCPDYEPT